MTFFSLPMQSDLVTVELVKEWVVKSTKTLFKFANTYFQHISTTMKLDSANILMRIFKPLQVQYGKWMKKMMTEFSQLIFLLNRCPTVCTHPILVMRSVMGQLHLYYWVLQTPIMKSEMGIAHIVGLDNKFIFLYIPNSNCFELHCEYGTHFRNVHSTVD